MIHIMNGATDLQGLRGRHNMLCKLFVARQKFEGPLERRVDPSGGICVGVPQIHCPEGKTRRGWRVKKTEWDVGSIHR